MRSAGMLDTLSKVIQVPNSSGSTGPGDEKAVRGKSRRLAASRDMARKQKRANAQQRRPVSPLTPLTSEVSAHGRSGRSSIGRSRSNMDSSRLSRSNAEGSHTDGSDSSHSGASQDETHDSHSEDETDYDNTATDDDHTGADTHNEDEHDEEDYEDGASTAGSSVAPQNVEKMDMSFDSAAASLSPISPISPGSAATTTGEYGDLIESKDENDAYDDDTNRFLHGARLSVFACLLCLVKSQENAFIIARDLTTVESLVGVSNLHHSPSHSHAIAILAHLTRHPKNCHQLVYKYASLLPMLQAATASPDKEARRYAFCALQNLSMDKSCRAPIAHSPKIIWSLTQRCKVKNMDTIIDDGNNEDEARMAAVATLQNLSDEPANLIQFTIVKDCIGTIIQTAREDVVKCEPTDLTSFMAKNTLVTLSHWFRKIATSGSERMRRDGPKQMAGFPPGFGGAPMGSGAGGVASPGGTARSQMNLYNARLDPVVHNHWS